MKKVIFLLFLILMPFAVAEGIAEDIIITLDGADLTEPAKLLPGSEHVLRILIRSGITVKDIKAISSNNFVKKIIHMQNLREGIGIKTQKELVVAHKLNLPSLLPAGTFTANIEIYYSKSGESRRVSKNLEFTVPPHGIKSILLGWASHTFSVDVLNEIVNYFIPQKAAVIKSEFTKEDLLQLGAHRLELTPEEVENEMYTVSITKVEEKEIEITAENFELVTSKINDDSTKEAVISLADMDHPKITKTLVVGEIKNPLRETAIIVSKVILSIEASKGLIDADIIEYVPKKIADDVMKIKFKNAPAVLEEDPVVRWDYASIPSDRYQYTAYLLEGQAELSDLVTVAGGRTPSFSAKLVRFFLYGGWIIAAFTLIGILAYAAYTAYRLFT